MYRNGLITSVRERRRELEVRDVLNSGRGRDREKKAGRRGDADSGEDERGDGGTHGDRERLEWMT